MTARIDLADVKERQWEGWSAGDYAVIGTTLQIVGESLCEALDLQAGTRVLDVAAGNGNATLAAARRWCDVTSTDYVARWLESGRQRAQAEGHLVKFQVADAEHLPFAEGSFDVVMSTFGVMFAPDHEKAASELVRACRPGGKIGLANWTPTSFIHELIATIRKYIQRPPGLRMPTLWGTRPRLDELFGGVAAHIHVTERAFVFRYRSPLHWVEVFRMYYGPLNQTFAALDADKQTALTRELIDLLELHNRSRDRTLVLPCEYLEVVIGLGSRSG
jgi:SAM-dependent methyltransferase